MTDARAWLSGRRPSPPEEVSDTLHVDAGNAPLHARLQAAAVRRLDESRSGARGAREDAFPLLAADALLTYACEAALESPDPDEALSSLMDMGDL